MLKLLAIMLVMISSAQAVIWNEGASGELRWGEALIFGNYSLNLIDFSTEGSVVPMALVELQVDNITQGSRALQAGEFFSLNDSVKVTARKVVMGDRGDEPYAEFRIQLPASPDISLLLTANKEVYLGGDMIRLDLVIENKGVVDAEDLKITLDSNLPLVKASYSRSNLGAGRVWDEDKHTREIDPIKLNLRAPYLMEPAEIEVRAHAEYADEWGRRHEAWGGTRFSVAGPIKLHKHIEDRQDFGKSYYVTNTLQNIGNRTLHLALSDSTGSHFKTNSTLTWEFNLSPSETEFVSYQVRAKSPGEKLALPSSEICYIFENKKYKIFSESPIAEVVGPFIEGKRSVSPTRVAPGNEVSVSIELMNSGNEKAKVLWQDKVPGGAKLGHGRLNGSFMLLPSEKQKEEYVIQCLWPGEIRLPPTEIVYRDVWGNSFSLKTSPFTIMVEDEKTINATGLLDSKNKIHEYTMNDCDASPNEFEENNWPLLLLVMVLGLGAAFSRYP
jgi:hypothetical protein